MTEDMIKKAAKEENFDLITALNLNLTRGGKKIKVNFFGITSFKV